MGKGRVFLQRLVDEAEPGMVPGHPIVELAGDRRVLIENHLGVREYGKERITVGMGYGQVSVVGQNLEILRMTREQLVIRGTITSLQVQRRGRP